MHEQSGPWRIKFCRGVWCARGLANQCFIWNRSHRTDGEFDCVTGQFGIRRRGSIERRDFGAVILCNWRGELADHGGAGHNLQLERELFSDRDRRRNWAADHYERLLTGGDAGSKSEWNWLPCKCGFCLDGIELCRSVLHGSRNSELRCDDELRSRKRRRSSGADKQQQRGDSAVDSYGGSRFDER